MPSTEIKPSPSSTAEPVALATSPLPLSASSEESKPRDMSGLGSTSDKKEGEVKEKLIEKGLMLPPPIPPVKDTPARPARMARMPSLKELSHHLNYTPSSTSSSAFPNPMGTPGQSPISIPATPPSLRIATGSLPHSTPGINQSPLIAPSPSSRLRLPASAMMRSLSSGSNGGSMGTPLETVHSPSWASRGFSSETGGDLFASPQTATMKDVHGMTPKSESSLSGADPQTAGVLAPTPAGSAKASGPLAGRENAPPMSRTSSTNSYIQGYNNVPSLDQIRRRVSISLARSGSVSAAISAGPPTATTKPSVIAPIVGSETVASPSTATTIARGANADNSPPETASTSSSTEEESDGKKKEHPLAHAWTLFFDSKTYKPDTSMQKKEGGHMLADYEMTLLTVGKFDTVEGFARHLNNVRLPSLLNKNSNYHMFKNGIRPMWEDPANANGGKWVILFRSSPPTLDTAWANLTMALVGEVLDPEDQVCGIVASNRPKIDRLQIWTRNRDDVEKMNRLGKKIIEAMGLEGRDADCMSMEYQYNASNSSPPPNKFIHIPFNNANARSTPSSTPQIGRLSASSSFHGPPGSSGAGGGMGVGLGILSHPSPRSSGIAFPGGPTSMGAQKSPTNPSFAFGSASGSHHNANVPGGSGDGGMLEPPSSTGSGSSASRSRLGSGANAFAGPMGMVRLGSNGGGGSGGSLSASPSPSVSPSPTPRPMRAEKA